MSRIDEELEALMKNEGQTEQERKREIAHVAIEQVTTSVISYTLLVKAIRRAKRGEYPSAIFHALLWAGMTSNANLWVLANVERYKRLGLVKR